MSHNRTFGGRTLARSQALQLVFQAEATGRSVDDVLSGDYALSDGPLDPFGEELARGAWSMLPELDAVIRSVSTNWSLERMPSVDRNLLRISLYEMLMVDEVAIPVTIDECVELAKAYGTDESSRFVNGVLGHIARDLERGVDVLAQAREDVRAAQEAEQAEPAGNEPEQDTAAEDGAEPEGDAEPESADDEASPVAGAASDESEDL